MKQVFYWLLATGCWLLPTCLAGCGMSHDERVASNAVRDYYAGNFELARQELRPLAEQTDENFVLNNLRLGSASLPDYRLDEGEAAFLKAYEVINSMGVNSGGRTLGAVLVSEKMKIWKGEPFERAMANFYLGMIYYIHHDYNNSRAAFENALFKLQDDPDSGKGHEQESNFALARVMLAKSWQRLGREDLARSNFDILKKQQPALSGLADYDRNLNSNVLLVADYGYGPRKVTNSDGSIVGFGPAPWQEGSIPLPRVMVDGRAVVLDDSARPTIDLLAMAQDRKWQSIDTIRTIKSVVGTGLMIAGGVEGIRGLNERGSAQRRDLIAGAALLGAGALLKATSHADVRQWEMLPRSVFVLPMKLPPGTHDITVEFSYGVSQTWRGLVVPPQGEATYYFRMMRWSSGPFQWPPATAAPAPSNAVQ